MHGHDPRVSLRWPWNQAWPAVRQLYAIPNRVKMWNISKEGRILPKGAVFVFLFFPWKRKISKRRESDTAISLLFVQNYFGILSDCLLWALFQTGLPTAASWSNLITPPVIYFYPDPETCLKYEQKPESMRQHSFHISIFIPAKTRSF